MSMKLDWPIKLTIKTTGGNCEMEVPAEATVEMLRAIVYSAKPELGEDVRLLFQGKVLKNDGDLLSAYGVKDGDAVAAVKGNSAKAPPAAAPAAASPAPPPEELAEETTPANSAPPPRAEETAAPAVFNPYAAAASAAPAAAKATAARDAPAKTEAAAPAVFNPYAAPASAAAAAAKATPARDAPAKSEAAAAASSEMSLEAQEPAAKRARTKNVGEEKAEAGAAEGATTAQAPAADVAATPESLAALAARVESGEVPPEEVAAMLRKAAERVEILGSVVNELGQALQLVNRLSGRVLQQNGAPVVSGPNGAPFAQAPKEEESRSFMVKKGDADMQALHERANAMGTGNRASPTSPSNGAAPGTCGGGSTNASTTPMSREDMDKARQARLARLEKKQADKQKEKGDAEEKSRSRLALERMGTVGAAKPIGKF